MEQKTIGKEYTLSELIRFASSPILTQLALSLLQTLDDGLFISRYIGPNALAAFQICMPAMMTLDSVTALVMGTSAYCAAKMGEGRTKEAAGDFSSMAMLAVGFGLIVSVVVHLFLEPILRLLGATDILMPYCLPFADLLLWYFPLNLLARLFSSFYVTAGKPSYSMVTTLTNSFCNFFFDWLFVARLGLGMRGVAMANFFGLVAVVVFGFVFYLGKNCEIGLGKPTRAPWTPLWAITKIGFPRMLTSLALGISSAIGNHVILRAGGEVGVSASSIVGSLQFMFMSAFFGLYSAVCPIASYAFGEKNPKKLRRIIRQSILLTALLSVVIIILYLIGRVPLTALYIREDADPTMRQLSYEGLRVAPFAFLFFGFVVLGEHMFSAIQNTQASSLITICENIIFCNLFTIWMPQVWGMNGYWWAFPVYEFVTFLVALYCYFRYQDTYGYGPSGKATAFE